MDPWFPLPFEIAPDARWYNTSSSGNASAAPKFSSVTDSDIITPHTQTDVLSLSPSSTIIPIPPLSGSRNRQGSMLGRRHPFANPSRRLQRQSTTSSATQPRIARPSTISSSSFVPLQSTLELPTSMSIPPSYMPLPSIQWPQDGHETRAAKRRRTNGHDTAVPEPPQVQLPLIAHIYGHDDLLSQTWPLNDTDAHCIPSIEEPPQNLTLEELMRQKLPENLTGQVIVPDFRRPAHGGFATVHKGEWNDRTVAVKVLKATKNSKKPGRWETSMERRLSREIRVWAALSHPNIAEFLGFADHFGDFSAMISTWCRQGTANDYLSENENITIQGRIRLVQDVAHGLKYLHGLRIIHGDLKPTNVLIDDNHVARLCDFGLVRLDDWQGPGGMTTTSPYTGTERYKAPELFISIDNTHPLATSEGDIYALGCIILEFVESRLPYERYNHSHRLVKAIAEGEPPASRPQNLYDMGPRKDLWYILETCWKSSPEDRPKADEVVDDLAHFSKALSTVYSDLGEADWDRK